VEAAEVGAAAVVVGGADVYRPARIAMEINMRVDGVDGGARMRTWARLSLVLAVAVLAAAAARAAVPAQKTYASPEEAVAALVQAVKANDRSAKLTVLGDATGFMSSGDAAADRATAARFVARYDLKHTIVRDGDKATLTIGDDDYPFAFPIVKSGELWRFDAAAGRDEMLARRIGANELDAIKVMQAIVDAQREYASEDRNGDGVLDYAQKFESSPGKHDGLYWKTKTGEQASPMGELAARASGEGYRKNEKGPTPYHGYYYRMLKGQTKSAESGAVDYVVKGHAIGGFAVIAWPAKYGNSGIMTFIVNQDGKIYQADLGPETSTRAREVQRFDPGTGWSQVKAP
jgi:hypothetical protein